MKKSRLGAIAVRSLSAALLLMPLLVLQEATARADEPFTFGPGLRPFIHTDGAGRTLMDVCPDRGPGMKRCFSQKILPSGPPTDVPFLGGSACSSMGGGGSVAVPKGAMTPSNLNTRYNIPSSAAANGAIVALVDLPSTNAMTDVNTYRAEFGIPILPACPVNGSGVPTPGGVACFARVGIDGTVNSVTTTDCPGWAGETALDIEMVSATCPDCSIVVAEAQDAFGTDLDQMDVIAATVLGALAASNSWGAPESGFDDTSFYMNAGMTAVASSGDWGFDSESIGGSAPAFPGSSPYVLSVGGTKLFASASSSSESVWNDGLANGLTTSGCSTEFAMPAYQESSGFNFSTCSNRVVADVSAAADFSNGMLLGGIAVYDTDDGGWVSFIGTSASSPIIAGIIVRLGLAGKDNHTILYENGGAFNDITTGNDDPMGLCGGTVLCTAVRGWDGPTGLGTPNGALLLAVAGGAMYPEPDAGPPDSGGPVCTNDTQCSDPTPICNPSGMCIGCTTDADCKGNAAGNACTAGSCVPCTKDADCKEPTPVCNLLTNECTAGGDGGSDASTGPEGGADSGSGSHMDSGTDSGAKMMAGSPAASSGCSCMTGPARDNELAAPMLLSLGLFAYGRRRRRLSRKA
jgi:MYXO-CTERM domain-containing protein